MDGSFGTREILCIFLLAVFVLGPSKLPELGESLVGAIQPSKREFYQTDRFATEATPAISKLPDTLNSK